MDSRPADPRTNTTVKRVLRLGLGVSLALLLVGLVVQLVSGHDEALPVKMFALFAPKAAGEKIMALGSLVLAVTPAVGLVTVVANWAREGDHRFVGTGAVVVAVLAAAVGVGLLRGG